MSKKFEVCYSVRGSITIEANSPEEAKELLLSSDYTSTDELFKGVERSIESVGNDAIDIDDVYENDNA